MDRRFLEREIDDWIADLASPSFLVRTQALGALFHAPVGAVPAVLAAAGQGRIHYAIQDGVAAWLGSYGEEGIAELCEHWAEAPMLVMSALVAAGDEAIPALMEALTSESDEARRWAAYGLAHFGPRARIARFVLQAAARRPHSARTAQEIEHARERTTDHAGN